MASDNWAGRRTGSRSSFRVATLLGALSREHRACLARDTSPWWTNFSAWRPRRINSSSGLGSCAILWHTVGLPPTEAPTPVCGKGESCFPSQPLLVPADVSLKTFQLRHFWAWSLALYADLMASKLTTRAHLNWPRKKLGTPCRHRTLQRNSACKFPHAS